jgi:Ca2+-binding EF-hand superfamily protein
MRGVGAENLVDHADKDKAVILGMVFTIILDYAARGFGGAASEVKRALLEWVNKKTLGYERVNPPGVTGFTKDWRSGLAWCALIHKHRPDLLDYNQCLGQSNKENLELAFSVAERDLGIPRLLDVDDCDVETPDEKSVITYTMEYFFRFASEGLKEAAAAQAAEWLKFLREIFARQNDYERRARLLLNWVNQTRNSWDNYNFGDSIQDATKAFNDLRNFVTQQKPPQEGEKMDLEALYAEIQTTLKVNGLAPYEPPGDCTPERIQELMDLLTQDQNEHGRKVRENRFRFIEKKEDKSGDELARQIKESFDSFDASKNGKLSAIEFEAACMKLGVVSKDQAAKDALFAKLAAGQPEISYDNYFAWMKSRLVVSLDDPDSVRSAFSTLADGKKGLSEADLHLLSADDQEFVRQNFKKVDGLYDSNHFVTQAMGR